ncbi:MAG: DUF3308 domain-containing protein [Bacteroidetes bacterium SW_11_45_7]|nr:MAG: DUF3308 domain-containing protein [Bacteroidetes bacterium SW_11_45_7]
MSNKIFALIAIIILCGCYVANAGNPDRKGEAGAYELLMNPWAKSSGLYSLNTARIQGMEAMRVNPAGLAFTRKTEINFSHSIWASGTDMGINALGVAQRVGETNTIGLNIMALDFGEVDRTTYRNPEGGLGTFNPSFFNIGVSYARAFSNSIYAGATVRVISESIENVSSTGVAIDAGLQYVTGERDQARFGLSLRNVGTTMKFTGDGLSFRGNEPGGDYQQTLNQRSEPFELPSMLNIGASYDFYLDAQVDTPNHRLTTLANFTSNSFGRDEYGAGIEYGFKEYLSIRFAFRGETGMYDPETLKTSIYAGPSAGVTFQIPFEEDGPAIAVDYAYQHTQPFSGTHTFGLRFNL